MQNNYFVKNMVERISRGDFTYFLSKEEYQSIASILGKKSIAYQIYKPYTEAEKVILWKQRKPLVSVYEIETSGKLTHSMIMGTFYAHSIKKEMYGDILVGEKTFILLLRSCEEYIISAVDKIGKQKVHFRKARFSEIENYRPLYDNVKIKTSSTRLDATLSKLLKMSRSSTEKLLKEKNMIVNGLIMMKGSITLQKGDVFSIRGYGKFKVRDIEYVKNNVQMYLEQYK